MQRGAERLALSDELRGLGLAPEPVYTEWIWLLFLIGVTAKPRSVLYRCIGCKQVLASTRDPKVLARFD